MSKAKPTRYADVPGWELSDSFWARIEPLLPKPKSRLRRRRGRLLHIGGRPRADARTLMTAILYTLRTGCQWNALPKEYGSGKTAHQYFLRWVRSGVFRRMWQAGLTEYDELKGCAWKWQAADGAQSKAALGGEKTGPNPTDRGKSGTKRNLLVDARGVPLAIVVSGANTPINRCWGRPSPSPRSNHPWPRPRTCAWTRATRASRLRGSRRRTLWSCMCRTKRMQKN